MCTLANNHVAARNNLKGARNRGHDGHGALAPQKRPFSRATEPTRLVCCCSFYDQALEPARQLGVRGVLGALAFTDVGRRLGKVPLKVCEKETERARARERHAHTHTAQNLPSEGMDVLTLCVVKALSTKGRAPYNNNAYFCFLKFFLEFPTTHLFALVAWSGVPWRVPALLLCCWISRR